MIIAKDKIKTNIGEYFIYMFQIEDLLRACNLDKNIVESNLISQYKVDDSVKIEISEWYFGLIKLMSEEKLEKSGHINFVSNKINEVMEFHQYLLQSSDHIDYQNKFKDVAPIIDELKIKQNNSKNDIDIILNAIYGIYLLKLKKQQITDDTLASTGKLSALLSLLSKKFKDYESGELSIE